MFKGIINWFKGDGGMQVVTNGETDMTATITKLNNGKFRLATRDQSAIFGTYSRRRDAVRGATRRGLTVA